MMLNNVYDYLLSLKKSVKNLCFIPKFSVIIKRSLTMGNTAQQLKMVNDRLAVWRGKCFDLKLFKAIIIKLCANINLFIFLGEPAERKMYLSFLMTRLFPFFIPFCEK